MSLTAVHWFDLPRFMKEVDRILKPLGCVAFSSCTLDVQIHYKDCSEKLTEIFRDVRRQRDLSQETPTCCDDGGSR